VQAAAAAASVLFRGALLLLCLNLLHPIPLAGVHRKVSWLILHQDGSTQTVLMDKRQLTQVRTKQ